MKYDVSVLVPSIRLPLWQGLYESIQYSFSGSWEIIFVGPHEKPVEFAHVDNIKCIKDFGCPTRCRQIALTQCQGDWVCYAADDVLFYPDALDLAFTKLKDCDFDYDTIVLGKYTEAVRNNPKMLGDDYYRLSWHEGCAPLQKWLPHEYYLIMSGLVSTKLLKQLGGWDSQFEVCSVSCLDLCLRLQNYGVTILTQNEPLFHASHLPANAGDHGPIHNAHMEHDTPLLESIYGQEISQQRTTIPIDNWKNAPNVWSRRFQIIQ